MNRQSRSFSDVVSTNKQEWHISLVCLILCVCDLIILVQTQYRLNAEKARKEADALRLRAEAQMELYEEEHKKLTQIGKIYHDMKHHFNYIQSLTDNQKIRASAKRYGGEAVVEAREGTFILTVMIPVPADS